MDDKTNEELHQESGVSVLASPAGAPPKPNVRVMTEREFRRHRNQQKRMRGKPKPKTAPTMPAQPLSDSQRLHECAMIIERCSRDVAPGAKATEIDTAIAALDMTLGHLKMIRGIKRKRFTKPPARKRRGR